MIEIMAGNFLVVGDGEENFESLPEDMCEKYSKLFEKPEKFFNLAGQIVVQKVDLPKEKDIVIKNVDQER